jgi:MFS family permease
MHTSPTAPNSALAPLGYGTFRAIWLASLASNLGGLIQAVGAAWLMTSIAGSADMVALVQASTTLPIMLFSLVAGAVADSFDRRRVMLTAQFFMLAVSTALALTAWAGLITPWLLLGFTFLIGCGTALNNPSWQASVGDIVPRADLPAAVTLNSVGFNLTRSVGPAIGGTIIAAAGVAVAFAANAVSYLGLIAVLLRWRPPPREAKLPREPLGLAIVAGVRYVAMSPGLGRILLRSFAFGLAAIALLALLPLVARNLVGGGPLTYGVLLGAFGLGAVGGAVLNPGLRSLLSTEGVVRVAFAGFALAAATAAWSPSAWITGAGMLVGGASWVLALSLFNTTVQLSTPRWVVGRALALYQTATFGGMALGAWLWGLLADAQGLDSALYAAAGTLVAGGVIGLRLPLPPPIEQNLDPLGRWKEPHVAVDVTPRSGPVAVMIEYRIAEADIAAFLSVMAERHRIRRRDGARHWTLLRDVEDPELWYESYQTPTWTEYVRHNTRATQADAAVGERIRALQKGPERPRVHRMIVRQTGWGHVEQTPKAPVDIH